MVTIVCAGEESTCKQNTTSPLLETSFLIGNIGDFDKIMLADGLESV